MRNRAGTHSLKIPTSFPLCVLALGLWLCGCAPARYPAGEALLKGETPRLPPVPDSLRAELEFTALQNGRATSVAGAFAALPYRRYKLDLFGLPGLLAASFLWEDTGWSLALFDRDGYARGKGEKASMPGLGLGPLPVHTLFSFLWGDFFPGLPDSARGGKPPALRRLEDGRFGYGAGSEQWTLRVDARTGVVLEAARADSSLRLLYGDYGIVNGRPLPHEVKVFAWSDPALRIRVGKVEDDPAWHRNPFFLKIPRGFHPIESPH